MPGIYLPRSYHEQQEQRRAELAADWYAQTTPDFGDAMELQRRLQLRDPRLSVTWAKGGPHKDRWVIIRQADTGEVFVVSVFENAQGEYDRPNPSVADNLLNLAGRNGEEMLRDIERREQLERETEKRQQDEFYAELGDRIATDVRTAAGVKDTILVPRSAK